MTVIEIINHVCREIGLQPPPSLIGNQTTKAQQYVALMNRLAVDLCWQVDWPTMIKYVRVHNETVWSQLVPSDFIKLCDEQPKIIGQPIERKKVTISRSAVDDVEAPEVNGGRLHGNPDPDCFLKRSEITFDGNLIRTRPVKTYATNAYIPYHSDSSFYRNDRANCSKHIESDTDKSMLNSSLLISGLKVKIKQASGLDVSFDVLEFDSIFNRCKSLGKTAKDLKLSSDVAPKRTWSELFAFNSV